MHRPIVTEPRLKEFHWEDLADFHLDLCYVRHRFIQTVNEKVASQTPVNVEELERLAEVDDLLKAAGETLEKAKGVLFDFCYKGGGSVEGGR